MPSSKHASYPKSCLKRPSAFPVVHPSDLPEYDHEYDINSSSMRDWDSLFTPSFSTAYPSSSRGTVGSDGRSIVSTSTTACGSARQSAKSVSFCDVNDVHVYTPEPLPPERPRGVVSRLLREFTVQDFVAIIIYSSMFTPSTQRHVRMLFDLIVRLHLRIRKQMQGVLSKSNLDTEVEYIRWRLNTSAVLRR